MNPRLLKRVAVTFVAFFFSAAFILVLIRLTPNVSSRLPDMRKVTSLPGHFASQLKHIQTSCASDGDTENPLTALDAKYAHLMDDKFTYVNIKAHTSLFL